MWEEYWKIWSTLFDVIFCLYFINGGQWRAMEGLTKCDMVQHAPCMLFLYLHLTVQTYGFSFPVWFSFFQWISSKICGIRIIQVISIFFTQWLAQYPSTQNNATNSSLICSYNYIQVELIVCFWSRCVCSLMDVCIILILKWALHGPHSMICLLWTTMFSKLHISFTTRHMCVGLTSFWI